MYRAIMSAEPLNPDDDERTKALGRARLSISEQRHRLTIRKIDGCPCRIWIRRSSKRRPHSAIGHSKQKPRIVQMRIYQAIAAIGRGGLVGRDDDGNDSGSRRRQKMEVAANPDSVTEKVGVVAEAAGGVEKPTGGGKTRRCRGEPDGEGSETRRRAAKQLEWNETRRRQRQGRVRSSELDDTVPRKHGAGQIEKTRPLLGATAASRQ